MIHQDVFDTLQRGNTNYATIALHALKRLPTTLREMLRESGELDDVISWALVAAVEGYQEGWDFRETYNAAQRYIYLALKAAGFRRQSRAKSGPAMPYYRREISVSPDELQQLGGGL